MNRQEILELCSKFQIKSHDAGNNIMISCPVSKFSIGHNFGEDRKPSFGISVSDFGGSICHCFSCGEKGGFAYLANKWFSRGWVSREFRDFVCEREKVSARSIVQRLESKSNQSSKQESNISKFEEKRYQNFISDRGGDWYFNKRGVTPHEIVKYQLGYDSYLKRVIFPFFDQSNVLCGCEGRVVDDNDYPKYRKYPFLKECLFGENILDPNEPRIVIVEGFLDAITISRYTKNVIALSRLDISEQKVEFCLNNAEYIVLMLDGGAAGWGATRKLGRMFCRRVPCFGVFLPDKIDPSDLSLIAFDNYISRKEKIF